MGWYYSNARIDELLPAIQQELDDDQRQAMLDEVHMILKGDIAYVSVHVQPLVWATNSIIELRQRPDNFFISRWTLAN